MTLIQWFLLAALALLGLAMLMSVGLLAATFVKFRHDSIQELSLLKRLEVVSNQTKAQDPPRKRFHIGWSR